MNRASDSWLVENPVKQVMLSLVKGKCDRKARFSLTRRGNFTLTFGYSSTILNGKCASARCEIRGASYNSLEGLGAATGVGQIGWKIQSSSSVFARILDETLELVPSADVMSQSRSSKTTESLFKSWDKGG